MAILLDQGGASLFDQLGVLIYDQLGAPPVTTSGLNALLFGGSVTTSNRFGGSVQ